MGQAPCGCPACPESCEALCGDDPSHNFDRKVMAVHASLANEAGELMLEDLRAAFDKLGASKSEFAPMTDEDLEAVASAAAGPTRKTSVNRSEFLEIVNEFLLRRAERLLDGRWIPARPELWPHKHCARDNRTIEEWNDGGHARFATYPGDSQSSGYEGTMRLVRGIGFDAIVVEYTFEKGGMAIAAGAVCESLHHFLADGTRYIRDSGEYWQLYDDLKDTASS